MQLASLILVLVVAILHIYFLILEIFLWTKPYGLRVFGQTLENAKNSAVLAANQGLYNGFLSAGLIWGVCYGDPVVSHHIKIFFLSCVAIAGVFGGVTVSKKIFFIQTVPALVALILIVI